MTEKKAKQADIFKQVFAPGKSWAVLGPPGSGKTSLAMDIAQAGLNHANAVCSNVILMRWDPETKKWKHASVKNYHHVRSFSQLMTLMPDFMEKKQPVILVLDEVMLASGLGGGQTILQGPVQSAIGLMTLQRKLGLSVILISQAVELLTSRLRDAEKGGLLRGYMRKVYKPGYSMQELVQFEIPLQGKALRTVELIGIARSIEMITRDDGTIDPDAIIFDTLSPAAFEQGFFPGTKKPFNMKGLLTHISGLLYDEIPNAIRAYMANPTAAEDEREEEKAETDEEGPAHTGDVKQTIMSMLLEGSTARQVIETVGSNRRAQVYKYLKELRDAGRLG